MQHEPLGLLRAQGVEPLGVAGGAKGHHAEHLGLPPLEQARAVGPGQNARVAIQRSYVPQTPSVGPLALAEDQCAELFLEHGLESVGDVPGLVVLPELLPHLALERGDAALLIGLPIAVFEGVGHPLPNHGADLVTQLAWIARAGEFGLRPAYLADHLLLHLDDLKIRLLGKLDAPQADLF